ncbi:flagellin [Sphingomonas jatrophae]|uniref:Flagellar hook-associated protein 3 FlgL n=1 Tax=Sphingomonas jatrophae TaxID=1166337 RepID=A0A1I6MAK9_9SPHN|nr:flagellin [Sphingomonas jatrophae]SFS12749.1 flagellar hook-associated protein 3 FlgL [Sphingomonas jatrophae]
MIGATSTRISAEIARQGKLAQSIARLQTDISSTKRLQAGSDDPAAAARVADIRRSEANQAVYAANVQAGAATATRVDGALESTATGLDRARELLMSARNGTQSAESRAAIATELAAIADDVAAARTATDSRGRPLFPEGTPLQLPIGEGVTTAATVSRDDAFGGMEEMLRAAAKAVSDGDPAAMQTGLDALVTQSDSLTRVRAEHGVRADRLDDAREALKSSALDLEEERVALEGTDLPAAIAQLQSQMLTLEAAQSVFAKLNAKTLFDLL